MKIAIFGTDTYTNGQKIIETVEKFTSDASQEFHLLYEPHGISYYLKNIPRKPNLIFDQFIYPGGKTPEEIILNRNVNIRKIFDQEPELLLIFVDDLETLDLIHVPEAMDKLIPAIRSIRLAVKLAEQIGTRIEYIF